MTGPTKPDLAAIEARVEAATEGPWEARHGGYSWVALYVDEDTIPEGESLPSFEPGGSATSADAEFIAHARTDVPALVAYARELEAAYTALLDRRGALELANREHIDRIDELETEVARLAKRIEDNHDYENEYLAEQIRREDAEAVVARVEALVEEIERQSRICNVGNTDMITGRLRAALATPTTTEGSKSDG